MATLDQPAEPVETGHRHGPALDLDSKDLRCSRCRYAITFRAPLPRCPECGSTSWDVLPKTETPR